MSATGPAGSPVLGTGPARSPQSGGDSDPGPEPAPVPAEALLPYSGVHAPIEGVFGQLARMAGLIFGVSLVSVSVAEDARLWFDVGTGPIDSRSLTGDSPSAQLSTDPDFCRQSACVIPDAQHDARVRTHPWVDRKDGVRFIAVAAVRMPDGTQIGTLEALGHQRRRRVGAVQLELLDGLARTVAQLLQLRVGAAAALRSAQDDLTAYRHHRERSDQLNAQASDAESDAADRVRPDWCQLGGRAACDRPAELKVVDSWGDSAWGCWAHAEDALVQVPSVFLASETTEGLAAYRARTSRA